MSRINNCFDLIKDKYLMVHEKFVKKLNEKVRPRRWHSLTLFELRNLKRKPRWDHI